MGTLSKDVLNQHLCEQLGITKTEAKEFLEVLIEEMRGSLENNLDLKLSNFGNFNLRNKSARPGRNPRTGEDAIVQPRRVVTFKAGPKLKEAVEAYRPEMNPDKPSD